MSRAPRLSSVTGLIASVVAVGAALTLVHPRTETAATAVTTAAPAAAHSPGAVVSPWGVATSHGSAQTPSRWLRALTASGITALRGFSETGELGRAAADRGIDTTGFLIWSARTGEPTFPVDDLAGWEAYVERTVRAQPQVRQWEVWNEPPNFSDNTSPAAYARLVQVAYRAIKSIDGALQVGLAAKSTDLPFLADALDAGAAGDYDFVTLHPYERVAELFDGWDENFVAVAGQTRAMLAVHDPGRQAVPIDFTEMGSPAGAVDGPRPGSHRTPADQADALVKAYTLALAQGVRRAYWYDIWDGDSPVGEQPFGLIDEKGRGRPAYAALKNLIAVLGAQPQFVAVRAIGSAATILEFSTPAGPLVVAWSSEGATLQLDKPARSMNVTGQLRPWTREIKLSPSPLIIPGLPAGTYTWTPRRSSTATRSGDGSYDATWSAGAGSTGLLVRGGRLVTVAGERVRDMSGSPALDMAVVPPTPSWTPLRLQVEVTVRGTAPDAGFRLRYDAGPEVPGTDSSGQAAAGPWQPVPRTSWRTFTWTLDSARLTGVFGINLGLQSDSPIHSRYLISQVRVHAERAP
jgi:hypothetical protein